MQFTVQREELLKPLQLVIGVVERRQTLPILANVLLSLDTSHLAITGTDLEVELVGRVELSTPVAQMGEITLPGRKLLDICRALPEQTALELTYTEANQRLLLRAGRSRFTLTTLPAAEFPRMEDNAKDFELDLDQTYLQFLTQRTAFAMAQQDVRYYLNGMLLEVNDGVVRAVATDGHRLALNTFNVNVKNNSPVQAIVPRKGVLELMRLLGSEEGVQASLVFGKNHLRVKGQDFTFTSKLIDGHFPEYQRVLPKGGDKQVIIDREELKQCLSRAAILSNEKFRAVRIQLDAGVMHVQANNPEQEQAEEELNIDYQGGQLEIGFNVNYIIDILANISSEKVKLTFSDPNSSVLIEEQNGMSNSLYVVMPMRL